MVATLQVRYAEKFVAGGTTVTFPLARYEYEPTQAYRVADKPIIGADYPYDSAGAAPWAKEVGIEAIRFLLHGSDPEALAAQYDTLVAGLRNGGRGALWTVDAAGDRRWCRAKLDGRPGYFSGVSKWGYTPVTLRFRRYSDWFAESEQTDVNDITVDGTLVINNPGNAPVDFMVIVLQPLSAGGFDNPRITNLENGYVTGTLRTSSATTERFRIDTERYLAEWSTDSGVNYAADYGNLYRGALQVGFMRLEPGDNTLSLTNTGSPNYRLSLTFSPAYH